MAKKKAATKKKVAKKKVTNVKTTRKVAAKKSVNKAEAIRVYAKSNPGAGPTAVSKALAAKGIEVTAGQVSTTLSNAKRNGQSKPSAKASRVKPIKPSATNDSVNITELLAARKFVKDIGDVSAARDLINVVAKLQD
ncbi:MAG: hypothetical protein AAGD11_11510 [Planctomycetota bacterium]